MDKKKIKNVFIIILVIAIALLLAFLAGMFLSNSKSDPEVTSDLISQRLSAVKDLVTVEYYYTNMGQFENQNDFYGWNVPFTKKSFIVSYDGVIKAGVNLDEVSVEVKGQTIEVTLPEPKIISHSIDENSLVVFDESKNIFNPITITDFTGFTADQKSKLENKAIGNGLLVEARSSAEEAIKSWLLLDTAIGKDYSIIVK